MSRSKLGLTIGTTGAIIGIGAGLLTALRSFSSASPKEPVVARLDTNGTYMIVATEGASRQFGEAIAEGRKLHPKAAQLVFPTTELKVVETAFRAQQPRYAMVFILPEELDVNFAWQWLRLTTQVDDDPFVDVRTGFITGESPAAALAFVRRIRAAVEQKTPLAGLAVDNLGPNTMAAKDSFSQMPGNFMIPVLAERLGLATISHGAEAFQKTERLASLDGAAIVHFGGHGYPDRVVDGVSGSQARQLKLAPCVAFNGACYTGVTGRWFDFQANITEARVAPEKSFCLAMLGNNVLGYLAALHPDHGIPVYQEMEFLATDGASLGDLIKHTYDGIILAAGGKLPALEPLTNGAPRPRWTASEVMLNGTASRVLFGDPALVLTSAFTAPAFDVTVRSDESKVLSVTAVLKNGNLKSTFTDTYHADLSSNPNLFNDRALITCALPDGWETVRLVEVDNVSAKAKTLRYRLVGFGVEKDEGRCLLHVQVDVPTSGYMESEFRTSGATVRLKVMK